MRLVSGMWGCMEIGDVLISQGIVLIRFSVFWALCIVRGGDMISP